MGGGANGWRTVAIIYAVIGLIVNTISALSVKELSDEELADRSSLLPSYKNGTECIS